MNEKDVMTMPAHTMYQRAKQFVEEEKRWYERENKILEAILSVKCPLAAAKGGRRPKRK
jgi:predicted NAD-dependent protein-ADP-ribosyltransferase YbiA (DUF1768 family)